MANGIDNSGVVLVFVTQNYRDKVSVVGNDYCKMEFDYSVQQKEVHNILPIVMEKRMTNVKNWVGQLGLAIGASLSVRMCFDFNRDNSEAFKAGMESMRKEINLLIFD